MRDTEHMKKHLFVVTKVDGNTINRLPVEDPFHTTKVTHIQEWSFWDWLKLAFKRRWTVEVVVRVESDGVSQGRWFQGADICENCKRTRLDKPGQHPTKPGYESHDMRVCEDCYYERVIPLSDTSGLCSSVE